jgi:LacI family transcriptional regulator, repressor for deo operon, udp, cdd, tsx, nupC, and nupG
MIKMRDVAKHAHVSTATVSRVLRNPSTVKEETRLKVLKVIEELNYQPNILARQLRTNKTNTILIVIPTITNTVFAEMLGGIESVATQNDYRVLLGNSNHQTERNIGYLDYLKQKQVDGVIFLTSELGENILNEIASEHPMVLASEYIQGARFPMVSIDNVLCGQKATEHLIELGHSRIAHLSGPFESLLSLDRLNGYKEALSAHHIKFDETLVQEGQFSFESGNRIMKEWLSRPHPPTAVFAANDEMAIGAMKAALELGKRIPEDLAMVGFDNIRFSSVFEPSLTTIAQPFFEMGAESMNLLIQQINQEPIPNNHFVLKSDLVIRQSCGSTQNIKR